MTLAQMAPWARGTPPQLVALCARNVESLVAAELLAIEGVRNVATTPGAVFFSGDQATMYRANMYLRCASRVLRVLQDVPCDAPDELYTEVRKFPWELYLGVKGTLAVNASGEAPGLRNSMFTALRTKDGVVDRFREKFGGRPDVDIEQPDVRINVQLYKRHGKSRALFALDSSDPALQKRGYRQQPGNAPMKETLAAAIVRMATEPIFHASPSGEAVHTFPFVRPTFASKIPIVDLCCGSGTLLIEAGQLALRRAPGLGRKFAFSRWKDFDPVLWTSIQAEAKETARICTEPFLYGADLDAVAVAGARNNLAAAGLASASRVIQSDLRDLGKPPGEPGIVLCNPPYGQRMDYGIDLAALYRAIGDTLKRHFAGYRAYIFTGNLEMTREFGLRASARHVFWNGAIEGRLLCFDLY